MPVTLSHHPMLPFDHSIDIVILLLMTAPYKTHVFLSWLLSLVSSTCGVFPYLKIVSPSDLGEVDADAEHFDKDQQADQQKQPMLTSKLDTWNLIGKNLFQDYLLY